MAKRKEIYNDILRDIWFLSIQEEEQTKEKVSTEKYRISGAGSCFLKHIHRINNSPKKVDRDMTLKLRIGSLLHEDLERAITKNKNMLIKRIADLTGDTPIEIHTERTVLVDEFNLIGHFDLVIEYEDFFDIVDFKFIHDFYWKKLFGVKRNRDKDAGKSYEKQIITYAMAVEIDLEKQLRNAIILYAKKSDMLSREYLVNKYVIEDTIDYWEELRLHHNNEDQLEPGVSLGCPFQSWECNYCEYNINGGIGGCKEKTI